MEVDRKLINSDFECYKLSLEEKFILDYLPLNSKCKGNETDGNVEFQVLADDIYENKLKRSTDKFYYLNEQSDLVCVSLGSSSSIISGPFESFGVAKDVVTCMKNGNLVIMKNGERRLETLPLEPTNVKILEVKLIGSSIQLILQQLSKVKDMKNGEKFSKSLDKTAFCFHSVVIDEGGFKCDSIGWSLSRPLVYYIRDGGEIILGTSTGIITNETGETGNIAYSEASEAYSEAADEDGSGDEDEDSSNVCRMTEFKNNSIIFQYPEIRISGSAVNDLQVQVAAKHLDDVIIFDLFSTGQAKHLTTFPALNFIQSGKIDKKFSVFGKGFAFILETSGNIYCYAKPADKGQQTSSQYLVQLDEEVYGWAYDNEGGDEEILFILTKEKIYKLKIN